MLIIDKCTKGGRKMKIGVPRGLLYYYYFPLWKTFYEELGHEIVLSGETNKNILNMGIKVCVDEACLPVKIFHGHVEDIKEKVDFLFIPRLMSVSYGEFICPKFCGLPEMIIHSIPELPPVLKPDFNFHGKKVNLNKTIEEMIGPLDIEFNAAQKAFHRGMEQIEIYKKNLYNGFLPQEALGFTEEMEPKDPIVKYKGRILVLSHPYHLYDTFTNMNLLKKMETMGYSTMTADTLSSERINYYAATLPKRMFWTFGREIIGAALYTLEEGLPIKGIVYLTSFACGVDSILVDYIERQFKRRSSIPFMQLTIDEHTGEAGIDTRLEAFIEMIERRDFDDRNLSPHGKCVYRG